jgi:hypothetical protein
MPEAGAEINSKIPITLPNVIGMLLSRAHELAKIRNSKLFGHQNAAFVPPKGIKIYFVIIDRLFEALLESAQSYTTRRSM